MENEGREKTDPARFAPGTMDQVLSGIDSSEIREKILRIAHESGVQREDPAWTLILLIVEAHAAKEWSGKAAQAAGVAADRIRTELGGLPDVIKTSVGSGMDIAANKLREASSQISAAAGAEIVKMQEAAKANIANALGGTLKGEIEKAVNQLKSQSNRPLHKKWGIAMGVAVLVALVLGGWGFRDITTYYEKVGYDSKAALNEKIQKDWPSFVNCRWPGWEIETRNGNEQWCFPFAKDPKTGEVIGWRIR